MAKTRSTSFSRPFSAHEQHALLTFGEHDFVSGHPGFALRNEIELDVETDAAARTHFASGASEAGSAHILNANDSAGLHGFETGFEEEFFHEGIADLHVGTLGFSAFVELLAGHGGAVNAVPAGFGAYIYDRVAGAAGFGIEDLILADEAECERVDERIA